MGFNGNWWCRKSSSGTCQDQHEQDHEMEGRVVENGDGVKHPGKGEGDTSNYRGN